MKIRAFVAEIFAKQYWCYLIIDFQCIFDISLFMHLRSLQRWIITVNAYKIFWKLDIKMYGRTDIMNKSTPVSAYRLLSSTSNKKIVYVNSHWTPCGVSIKEILDANSDFTCNVLCHDIIFHDVKCHDICHDVICHEIIFKDVMSYLMISYIMMQMSWHYMSWGHMSWHMSLNHMSLNHMSWRHMSWGHMSRGHMSRRHMSWSHMSWCNMSWRCMMHDVLWMMPILNLFMD